MTAAGVGAIATGWSLCLPGVQLGPALAAAGLSGPAGGGAAGAGAVGGGAAGAGAAGDAYPDCPPPDRAARLLGRRGLLSVEPATRLALCAVHLAFDLPAGQRPDWPLATDTAVVATGNLGNTGTVARLARTVAVEGGRAVSVLEAPNASSNVLASTVARWFRFGGPNLMVCSGSTAGLDGFRLALLLLRSGRAGRVVLVGAEPADEMAAALHRTGDPPGSLREGAGCLVLHAGGRAAGPVWLQPVPVDRPWPDQPWVTVGPGGFDPVAHWGDCYGGQGVVSLALAAQLAAGHGYQLVGVHCAGEDGVRRALVWGCGC